MSADGSTGIVGSYLHARRRVRGTRPGGRIKERLPRGATVFRGPLPSRSRHGFQLLEEDGRGTCEGAEDGLPRRRRLHVCRFLLRPHPSPHIQLRPDPADPHVHGDGLLQGHSFPLSDSPSDEVSRHVGGGVRGAGRNGTWQKDHQVNGCSSCKKGVDVWQMDRQERRQRWCWYVDLTDHDFRQLWLAQSDPRLQSSIHGVCRCRRSAAMLVSLSVEEY